MSALVTLANVLGILFCLAVVFAAGFVMGRRTDPMKRAEWLEAFEEARARYRYEAALALEAAEGAAQEGERG